MGKAKRPSFISRIERKVQANYRLLTSSRRTLPEFLIIGAAKCGTTSLYNYLIQHPSVLPCFTKEVHFFDYYFHKGISWYRSQFPLLSELDNCKKAAGVPCITGESSPYYLAHPLAPRRVKEYLTGIKLICMLRNPVDRAISSYFNQVRLGIEKLPSFEEALAAEDERIRGHEERLSADPAYSSFEHKYFSYFKRGCYAEQLERWYEFFPKEQILVLQSEPFFSDPAPAYRDVLRFIGLPESEPPAYKVFNAGGEYDKMTPGLRQVLLEKYQPHNERLFSLIGRRFDEWNR